MNTTTNEVTIETIEALADRLEADEEATRAKLLRLIKAEARVLAVREPKAFKPMALSFADEDGHWDSSFPPAQQYKDHNGPRLLEVEDNSYDEIATSEGFYYSWRAASTDLGLFGCDVSGEGRVGQFAARPGNCGVELALNWSPRDLDDVSTEALRTVERVLRAKAFPLTPQTE